MPALAVQVFPAVSTENPAPQDVFGIGTLFSLGTHFLYLFSDRLYLCK